MRRTEAQRRKLSAERFRHAQSLANRRHRLSHAMVRSTIQRFGGTTNLCRSDRFTISRLTGRRRSAARPGTWRLASAVGVELQQEGIEAEQRAHRQHAAIAVLNVGSVDDGLHQQALGVDRDVALLALDLRARVVARRVDAGPPFSALLTLWLLCRGVVRQVLMAWSVAPSLPSSWTRPSLRGARASLRGRRWAAT
jgi:hypothetical protein